MDTHRIHRLVTLGFRPLLAAAVCLPVLIFTTASLAADPPVGGTREHAQPKKEERLISLVLLLREPRTLDEHSLANTVSTAVGIPHGHDESASSFVVAKPPYYLIKLASGRFVVNTIAEPYFKNTEKLAEGVKDPQLRQAIQAHRAWLAIDWAEKEEPADVKSVYQQLGKMAAALAGPDTLAVYNPDTDGLNVYDAALAESLKGDDPLKRFISASAAPEVISISNDDPRLKAAEAEAKKHWSDFVRAFREKRGEHFAVKGRISEGENAEYLWLSVTDIDNERVHGTLANAPVDLKGLKLGQDLHIKIDEVDDWLYLGPDKQPKGGFTQKVLAEAAKARSSE